MKRNRDKIWEHLADVNLEDSSIEEIPFSDLISEEELRELYEKSYNELYSSLIGTPEAITKAEREAENFGYGLCYCDGILSREEEIEYKTLIDFLVGDPWPESVQRAFNTGCNTGNWET